MSPASLGSTGLRLRLRLLLRLRLRRLNRGDRERECERARRVPLLLTLCRRRDDDDAGERERERERERRDLFEPPRAALSACTSWRRITTRKQEKTAQRPRQGEGEVAKLRSGTRQRSNQTSQKAEKLDQNNRAQ